MRESRLRLVVFAWLPILLHLAVVPDAVSAQAEPSGRWAVVPWLGFGVVHDGAWRSAGMEAAVELEYGGSAWRGSGYGSLRGLGVACSHACFDGGPALAVGGSRAVGALWIGGGVGAMRDFEEWHLLPFGRLSLDAARFRFDVRVELPQRSDVDVYLPVLIGIPLSWG